MFIPSHGGVYTFMARSNWQAEIGFRYMTKLENRSSLD